MINVVQNIQPSHTLSYTCYNRIECLTTRLLLPSNTYLNVVLVYRSPSSSIHIFANLLTTLLQNQSFLTVPTVIMGDFNDDIFNKLDSRIFNLMSTNGFKQLVSKPMTDRGTLIDHIYYNRPYYN